MIILGKLFRQKHYQNIHKIAHSSKFLSMIMPRTPFSMPICSYDIIISISKWLFSIQNCVKIYIKTHQLIHVFQNYSESSVPHSKRVAIKFFYGKYTPKRTKLYHLKKNYGNMSPNPFSKAYVFAT